MKIIIEVPERTIQHLLDILDKEYRSTPYIDTAFDLARISRNIKEQSEVKS